ncbi:MAG: tRNA epoxyqueuosine(34) reductase QueG [Planctomycetes bacterium]|nr:tRNA epoxyqueuosine(34) reductase QueG [Planctomycetota bacterium]
MPWSPSSPPPPILEIGRLAATLGLELRAAIPAGRLPEESLNRLDSWLEEGRAGTMQWLEEGRPAMGALTDWKPWARSSLLFTASYSRPGGGFRGGGKVARYALGRDYHNHLGRRLQKLGRRLREDGELGRFRAVVDAAPVLEREWALEGGVGFRGKNTLVLDPARGPWQLLAELIVDRDWPRWTPTPPAASCGSCTSCLDSCPTDAFTGPWSLDPRRCISYLTIECRGVIPRGLRPLMSDWVFGCDRCLEVCPFGTGGEDASETWGILPALGRWSLEDLLQVSEPDFDQAFEGSPIRRAGWAGLLRNACVALGNLGRGAEALLGATNHPEWLVRGHAAWALGRLGIRAPLAALLDREPDPRVLEEIRASLDQKGKS